MTNLLSALFLLTLLMCGRPSGSQDSTHAKHYTNPDWKTYEGANYSIQYPSDWELNTSGTMGTTFVILAPMESDTDAFRENVNLLIQDLTGRNMDLDKYSEISEEQIHTMLTNDTILESKSMTNGSEEYHRILYAGEQGDYFLEYLQYYWVKDNHAYVLTFTGEQVPFPDYRYLGESVLNSLVFKK